MTWRAVALVGIALALAGAPARADSVRYVLTDESRLVAICPGCDPAAISPQPLRGSFDVSRMPGPVEYGVESITGVRWQSGSIPISGSGFLQRLGSDRVAMVIDARFNGVPLLLTSGHRQRWRPDEIRLHLSSPTGVGNGVRLTLVAVPASPTGADRDGDGVADAADNCPTAPNLTQLDADADGVGEACDRCPETPLGGPVLADGCALVQACPCDGPSPDEEWTSPRAYVQCMARQLKLLRQQSRLGRAEIRLLLQDAVRSGCGRKIVAFG